MGPAALNQALSHLPPITDPRVLVGINTGDDAAVYELTPELALVQTLDFFTPVVDDPYDFGQISAANSLSDVYAMGGKPITALSIICFPAKDQPLEVMGRILRGAADKAKEAGIDIVGGHSVEDPEPKFGLAVTGTIHPDRVLTNKSAHPGDVVFLTKPLGSGVLTTALKRGILQPREICEVTAVMATLNAAASAAALEADAHVCTDVTGFGLVGHLCGILNGSGLGARLSFDSLPVMDRVRDLLREDVYPGGTRNNLDYYGTRLRLDPSLPTEAQRLVADPQTSGGLLIAVAADQEAKLAGALDNHGVDGWTRVLIAAANWRDVDRVSEHYERGESAERTWTQRTAARQLDVPWYPLRLGEEVCLSGLDDERGAWYENYERSRKAREDTDNDQGKLSLWRSAVRNRR